jgi:hypothetical protein
MPLPDAVAVTESDVGVSPRGLGNGALAPVHQARELAGRRHVARVQARVGGHHRGHAQLTARLQVAVHLRGIRMTGMSPRLEWLRVLSGG